MGNLVPSIYRHTQSVASTTWTIVHNLGGNGGQGVPAVDVLVPINGVDTKIMPDQITKTDSNTVTVTFSTARTGTAIVIV